MDFEFPERATNISDACKDLIRKILVADPIKRMTIAQIFQHPWVQQVRRVPVSQGGNRRVHSLLAAGLGWGRQRDGCGQLPPAHRFVSAIVKTTHPLSHCRAQDLPPGSVAYNDWALELQVQPAQVREQALGSRAGEGGPAAASKPHAAACSGCPAPPAPPCPHPTAATPAPFLHAEQ